MSTLSERLFMDLLAYTKSAYCGSLGVEYALSLAKMFTIAQLHTVMMFTRASTVSDAYDVSFIANGERVRKVSLSSEDIAKFKRYIGVWTEISRVGDHVYIVPRGLEVNIVNHFAKAGVNRLDTHDNLKRA